MGGLACAVSVSTLVGGGPGQAAVQPAADLPACLLHHDRPMPLHAPPLSRPTLARTLASFDPGPSLGLPPPKSIGHAGGDGSRGLAKRHAYDESERANYISNPALQRRAPASCAHQAVPAHTPPSVTSTQGPPRRFSGQPSAVITLA
jgi:hypothetical protein